MRARAAFGLVSALLIVALFGTSVDAHGDHREARQVTSYSFSPPFFPDAGLAAIPGWEVRGGTMVNTNYVRVTPDIGDKSGFLLARRPAYYQSFEITIQFRIHSEGRKPGADGLAFWITDTGLKQGPVFGGAAQWRGLAFFMDTFDNNGDGMQPSIAVHANNGDLITKMEDDGRDTLLGQCQVAYRNEEVSNLHIYFEDGLLHVYHDAKNNGQWTECAGPFEYKLPPRYYFGFSAATGGLSDNHDLFSFTVGTMDPPDMEYELPASEQRRMDRDESRAQKMQELKDEKAQNFIAANPDVVQLPPEPPELPKKPRKIFKEPEKIDESTAVQDLLQYIEKQNAAIEQLEIQLKHAGEQFSRMEKEAEDQEKLLEAAGEAKECDSGPEDAAPSADVSGEVAKLRSALQRIEVKMDEFSLNMHETKEKADTEYRDNAMKNELVMSIISAKTAIEKEIQTLYGVMNNDNRADAIQHDETQRAMQREVQEVGAQVSRVQSRLETMQKNYQSMSMRLNTMNTDEPQSNTFVIVLSVVQIILIVVLLGVSLVGGGRRRNDRLY